MARYVIAFRISPDEYYKLTLMERDALATEFNRSRR